MSALLWLAASTTFGARAHADVAAPALILRVEDGAPLVVGKAASISVLLLAEGPQQPLLLTPHAEGDALRVVRGRLSRADGQRAGSGWLRFQVPVVAKSAGTALFRIELLTYRCDAGNCRAVRASASSALHVVSAS